MDDDKTNDGADEQMLGSNDKQVLSGKKEDVKFTKNGDAQNGDAKIELGVPYDGKDFTGMSKEELMKYANDPLWVRLRWIFFIAFWLIWVGMLVGAIFIIIGAPKCAAPEDLSWYKVGPLLKSEALKFDQSILDKANKLHATGVIYELPAEDTYEIGRNPDVDTKIDEFVKNYKDSDVNIILDITPNYVNKNSWLFKEALESDEKRSAFVWEESQVEPNNWLAFDNRPAWSKVSDGNYVLSQFGSGLYDLQMNSTIVKNALLNSMETLVKKGVKGFRLKNSKYYLIWRNLINEEPAANIMSTMDKYNFWTHSQTSFQEGLGDFLAEIRARIKIIDHHIMVSVADDIIRPEVYQTKEGFYGIDTPRYGRLLHMMNQPSNSASINNEINNITRAVGNKTWIQWNFDELKENNLDGQNPAAIALFVSLLPGVKVIPENSHLIDSVDDHIYKQIHTLRSSPSFMHGEFNIYNSPNVVAYSRIKSGNPGYLVVLNPSDKEVTSDFSNLPLPEKMRIIAISPNFNVTGVNDKSQMNKSSITVSAKSTIVFSYVPV